jgi:hypothetical protein
MNALFYLFYHARRLVSGNGDYNLMYIFFLTLIPQHFDLTLFIST